MDGVRNPVDYRYDALDPEFLRFMAEIGEIGAAKYGVPYILGNPTTRLSGDKSPINHIYEHLRQYRMAVPYDNKASGDIRYHLAAVAYNAMMEFYMVTNGLPEPKV